MATNVSEASERLAYGNAKAIATWYFNKRREDSENRDLMDLTPADAWELKRIEDEHAQQQKRKERSERPKGADRGMYIKDRLIAFLCPSRWTKKHTARAPTKHWGNHLQCGKNKEGRAFTILYDTLNRKWYLILSYDARVKGAPLGESAFEALMKDQSASAKRARTWIRRKDMLFASSAGRGNMCSIDPGSRTPWTCFDEHRKLFYDVYDVIVMPGSRAAGAPCQSLNEGLASFLAAEGCFDHDAAELATQYLNVMALAEATDRSEADVAIQHVIDHIFAFDDAVTSNLNASVLQHQLSVLFCVIGGFAANGVAELWMIVGSTLSMIATQSNLRALHQRVLSLLWQIERNRSNLSECLPEGILSGQSGDYEHWDEKAWDDSSDSTQEVQNTECCVCLDGEIGTVLVPCGHMILCVPCSKNHMPSTKHEMI
ncbi:hypothetical protein HDU87_005759 [Geranomyces variabilis]|uniref:RING-type domain-containing protein n=1 Tax=Geranomyces variabilis TaxID=109894 RepID=A0AAD5TIK8_9FUNG|nr:hypothetical protein HDU87_005759 [Geranomyces variabilis]